MELETPQRLATELRARALSATDEERFDLLFLASEYERLGDVLSCDIGYRPLQVYLPK
ncbi:hypothetical protein [Sphingomonas sp. S2-65]|uniref:hypothetical protein n=1 Tax=Sphingomonas sp. S2-65 TaxID=2903960 RepID=UPI001F345698|nr:hypothetical protein [Sphingomonas sp. S2-65]UYY59618.1 hypothetical protein LZ586_05915 [Sphingomonas sp. S2-65]